MPKGSPELTAARREEIIDACAALYENMSFRDITIRDIGTKTTFTRTSIYNYFRTKEEIFLALLQREHDAWTEDLTRFTEENDRLSKEEFAEAMAVMLEKRGCMLKLMSMNIYDMEVNSRLESLVEFKRSYGRTIDVIEEMLEKFFPDMGKEDIEGFVYAFFPFLFGIYPYTSHTEKQLEAMKQAGIEYHEPSVAEIVKAFILKIL